MLFFTQKFDAEVDEKFIEVIMSLPNKVHILEPVFFLSYFTFLLDIIESARKAYNFKK